MGEPIFVVQHHQATADHYDFRLEIDGVLASWAVPKGPSTDPREKRMAKRVDDHDLSHADFEGLAGRSPQGVGAVIVWDRGTFTNTSRDRAGSPVSTLEALAAGHLSFDLHGQKLRGGYALIRFRDDEGIWLLVKKKDRSADARRRPTVTEPASVLTGRTIEDLRAEGGSTDA